MSIFKSSLFFSLGTLISRFSGLARDTVLASVFGAGTMLDAFIVAFRIPNLFREMLAEGALAGAFTKVFTDEMAEDSESAYTLFWSCWKFFSLLSLVFCSLGIYFSNDLVFLMNLSGDRSDFNIYFNNTLALTEILFPYLGVVILSSIIMGVLHEKGRYFITSISPILFNLGFIVGALFLGSVISLFRPYLNYSSDISNKLLGLAVGVLIGGVIQLLFQFYFIYRDRPDLFSFFRKSKLFSKKVKTVLRVMLPASVAASTGPINIFINTNFATGLGQGVVTWLNYSFRLLQLPVGVFGVAIGVAVLPPLTREIKKDNGNITGAVSQTFVNSIESVIWIMGSCSLFLYLESQNIISVLFGYGKFSSVDIEATSNALKAYSFATVGYGLIKVMTSFYYALGKTKYAMYVSVVSIFVNFISNYYLSQTIGYVGLALTSSITLTLNAIILFVVAIRLGVNVDFKQLIINLSKLIGALLICYSSVSIIDFMDFDFFEGKLQSLFSLVTTGGIFTVCLGFISCIRYPSLSQTIRAKFASIFQGR